MAIPVAANERSEYFGTIVSQATPVVDFIGKNKTEATASQRVQFDYDDQGQLIRIRYYQNGVLTNLPRIGAAEVRIEYTGHQEVRTYWDASGNPDFLWRICYRGLNFATEGKVHKEVFTLDGKGRRVALDLFDEKDEPAETYYGSDHYSWTWLDNETVIEKRTGRNAHSIPLTHFFDFERTRISFDDLGIHWLIENIDAEGILTNGRISKTASVRFEYNTDLNEADYSFYNAQDRIAERGAYGPMPFGFARITNTFSDDGRLLEEVYRDRFNQLVNNSAGFARAVYDYDENGTFKGTRFLSTNGDELEYRRPY